MEQTVDAAVAVATETRAGKYLTFGLADEEYGLEILKVREIFGMVNITAVPQTPEHVRGVINLRGKVIPVMDLRLKFCMAEKEHDEATCIIVVDVDGVEMGIIVDHVQEVIEISSEDIEDPPSLGSNVDTDFILGMGKLDKRVTILLDITKVLGHEDLSAMGTAEEKMELAGEPI